MFDLAQKLISSAQQWHIEDHSGILGQRTRSQRYSQKSLFRIGLWPIISKSKPEVGMGIGLILATLLEQRSSVRVYRLMAEVNELPSHYEWDVGESQFGVDDWEIEGLDENVAIWGTFEVQSSRVRFSIEVENDAREDDVVFELNHETDSLMEMLNFLPLVANKIIIWLDPLTTESLGEGYSNILGEDASLIEGFLNQVFHWELDYFLTLWGKISEQTHILSTLDKLVVLSQQMKSDFGAWMVAISMSRFIMFDEVDWSKFLVPLAKTTAESLDDHPVVTQVLGVTLFRLNYSLEAFDLLERTLVFHPEYSEIWNTLAMLYSEAHEDLAAIDVYQRAIEAEAVTSNTYLRYANLINLLSKQQIELKSGNKHISPAGRPFVERYIFADLNEKMVNLREAAAAYEQAFELDTTSLDSLSQLVTCLVSLQDNDAWKYCRTLVERDIEGGMIASLIEQLSEDDIELMSEILQKALTNDSQQVNIRINLVRAYLALNENTQAKSELAIISKNNIPAQVQPTLSRLRLIADNYDFESRIGEVKDILQARGKVSAADTEFLETIIEKEPSFSEGYKLLAESYLSWDEPDDALEVLLDCQNNAPFDADVTVLLAKVLWDADQPDLAFAYLDKGLKQDNRNATLLSLNGHFLFDNGQDEEAKEFLLRAEEIDPSNSELAVTRLYIANVLIETRKD